MRAEDDETQLIAVIAGRANGSYPLVSSRKLMVGGGAAVRQSLTGETIVARRVKRFGSSGTRRSAKLVPVPLADRYCRSGSHSGDEEIQHALHMRDAVIAAGR